jgi:hypothetical protein
MKIFSIAFLLIALHIASPAQSPSKVISAANKALGGERQLKRINSWSKTGTIRRLSDGATGKYSATASGGLYWSEFDLNGFEFATGYNGKSGWTRDSRDGLRTTTGDAAKDIQAVSSYRNWRWLKAKDERTKIATGGTATVNGRSAVVLNLTTPKGSQLRLFFDAQNGVLLREVLPDGDAETTFEYSDHRPVSGIQTPFAMTFIEDGETYEVKVDEVKYNGHVPRSVFDFPQVSGEPLPEIKPLLEDVRRNAERIDEILENYSYTETRIERDFNARGELIEKGSEKRLLTFYKGYRVSQTIEKNGRPLSANDKAKEERDALKQIADIEKRIADKERKRAASSGAAGQPDGESRRISIGDALKGSLLVNPRRERFRGREVIVFDYEPDPAFKPRTRMEKLFALCNGAVWVDAESKQVVRLDAVLAQSAGNFLAKAKRGASFTLENQLVNDEIWLPSQADVNLSIKILFAGFNINNLIRYGDYRRYETEVTDIAVGDEKP